MNLEIENNKDYIKKLENKLIDKKTCIKDLSVQIKK